MRIENSALTCIPNFKEQTTQWYEEENGYFEKQYSTIKNSDITLIRVVSYYANWYDPFLIFVMVNSDMVLVTTYILYDIRMPKYNPTIFCLKSYRKIVLRANI